MIPVGDQGSELRVPGRQRLHHFPEVGDQRVEMTRVAGQCVRQGLQVDEHRRQVGGSRVHVLASAGGRLAQGVDHQVELVANLRIERVEHLVDFDRGQRMVLVDGAALRDGPLRGMAAIELHVRFPQQVLLPDHGAGVLEDRREVLV